MVSDRDDLDDEYSYPRTRAVATVFEARGRKSMQSFHAEALGIAIALEQQSYL
jgi:hypothetical protein